MNFKSDFHFIDYSSLAFAIAVKDFLGSIVQSLVGIVLSLILQKLKNQYDQYECDFFVES